MKHLSYFRILAIAVACLTFADIGRSADEAPAPPETKPALPRLVDLGASKCVPCKMMKPILDKLTKDYAGQMEVVFIDVWEKREEGARYSIRVIPTQIFFDTTGKERFRHEGFISEKDILAKWKELGLELKSPASR
jgi:thioredoxin 1